ncbi:hypothetical protein GS506_24470 [Rhodococcus hoagii]|nr:hypothetical protein [Prescottella equi]
MARDGIVSGHPCFGSAPWGNRVAPSPRSAGGRGPVAAQWCTTHFACIDRPRNGGSPVDREGVRWVTFRPRGG